MSRLHALLLLLLMAPAVSAAVPAPAPDALRFPPGFVWGTATAAVQVEGDTPHSDWAEFEQRPGAIRGADRIGQAARHYDLYEEDFREARAMRTTGYRFSLEWSRLEPKRGEWDHAAEARYRRMLESLRAKGIRPMVTLHHFSNPNWVAAQGGWENPATIAAFEGFVRRVGAAYGHLVDDWVTFNEPTIYAAEGYIRGVFPPGKTGDFVALPRVLGHLARAHGQAYRALHQTDRLTAFPGGVPARVGVAEHMVAFYPAQAWSPLDLAWTAITETWINYAFLDAAKTGRLRFETVVARYWQDEPAMKGALDFVGVNYYTRSLMSAWAPLSRGSSPDGALTDLGLEIHPEGMATVLERVHDRYRLPIYVTETGIADESRAATPGFMVRYLAEVQRAAAKGVPVKGVYWWSLLDNFEWQNGYHGRFGLLAVDFKRPDRRRTWTPGAHTYARIAGANGIDADLLTRYLPDGPQGSATAHSSR